MPNDEWFTPARIIEAAREAMGGIDLDPASCKEANETVKAARLFDKWDDGLRQPWSGKVWVNPPFSNGMPRLFCKKAMAEVDLGRVDQVCILLPMPLHAQWFFDLTRWCSVICLCEDKVRFHGKCLETIPATVMVAYNGHHSHAFKRAFKDIGPLLAPV